MALQVIAPHSLVIKLNMSLIAVDILISNFELGRFIQYVLDCFIAISISTIHAMAHNFVNGSGSYCQQKWSIRLPTLRFSWYSYKEGLRIDSITIVVAVDGQGDDDTDDDQGEQAKSTVVKGW